MRPKGESDLLHTTTPSPLGELTLVASDDALVGVYFEGHRPAPRHGLGRPGSNAVLRRAVRELRAYFADPTHRFSIPLDPRGNDRERAVWRALRRIRPGQTSSYGVIADALGRAGAARAVGSAVARNPLSIIVPCHRVIGADGGLAGFAGGVDRKVWLLEHEAAEVTSAAAAPSSRRATSRRRTDRADRAAR